MMYRDHRIVHVDYAGPECMGFKMPKAFKVMDEFDEPTLPLVQQTFWTPGDAVSAIHMSEVVAPGLKGPKWPTTVQYEYNIMLLYRANFDRVFHAIQKIKKAIRDAKDFDENPSEEITKILNSLHQYMHESGARTLG